MRKFKVILAAAALAVLAAAGCRPYESVGGDPLKARIYTLDNGLKVYLTVNKDEPRIQTYIAVRSGGKNDPADNTGLAHYLEHMMFKGTEQFGTQDYEAEKPLLEQIDNLFEEYRTITDPVERLAFYHRIDSVSYEASKLAIPNEYDKLMSIIGASGTNAYTSNDVTCYVDEIPSNQIDNWAKIAADRFMNCVFRGFHTELEAVYEEKNMGLSSDSEKMFDALDSMLFVNHPYGTQTVIGTQEHLKNPSLKAIRYQKDTYYVPNNVAVCMSGDFNPDEVIKIIRKYFGQWKPNPDLPEFTFEPEEPITTPKVKDVYGPEAEYIALAWRTPGASSKESDLSQIVCSVLTNGMAGLIDLDVIQKQAVLDAGGFAYDRTDYGMFLLEAFPKEGQSLEEVRDIILAEVAKLRDGDFPEELVTASVNNYKLREMSSLERNRSRADKFVDSFINGTSWKDEVGKIGRIEKATKEDIVKWAYEYLRPESYAIVYKHIGVDTSIKKIDAPKITPIVTNRDKQSEFLKAIAASEVAEIEPVFVDFSKDLTIEPYEGTEILYKKNEKNDIGTLTLRFDRGTDNDPMLELASSYIDYLGTEELSAEDIASKMYSLACHFSFRVGGNTTDISVTGLDENLPEALSMLESLVLGAKADDAVLETLKADIIRSRADSKLNQRACSGALQSYLIYGPEYIKNGTLSTEKLIAATSDEVLGSLRDLYGCKHRILYYGPSSLSKVKGTLAASHKISPDAPALRKTYPVKQPTPSTEVFVVDYNAPQFNYVQYSDRGESFDIAEAAKIALFNEYYGGSMNSIVFQEMRESRALAYGAGAWLSEPYYAADTYSFRAYIASQNDKLRKAVEGFDEIIEDLPEAEENLQIAKSAILSRLRTQRTIGISVLYSYLSARELGLDYPKDKAVYEGVGALGMEDLLKTHEEWVKGRTYHYSILGRTSDLDMPFLRTLGPVRMVSLEEIFGY